MIAGIAVALAPVLPTMATADPDGSIIIGTLLVAVALAIDAETKSVLIDEIAAPSVRRAIHEFLSARALVVAAKVHMQPMATPRELVDAINAGKAQLFAAFPQVRWVFFEPDPAAGAADRSRSC